MITKVYYYSPRISITAEELYNVVKNWIKPDEWAQEGFASHCTKDGKTLYGTYSHSEKHFAFRFSALDERSPLIVTGTNKREMQKIASKLSRILKTGPFNKVDEGEFV